MDNLASKIIKFFLLIFLIVSFAIFAPNYFAWLRYPRLRFDLTFYALIVVASFLYTYHTFKKEHLKEPRFWLKFLVILIACFIVSQFVLNLIEPFMFEITI
ncbi:hypothetical protein A2962_02810 [Candidatus Woesebacteria bacterium RIFCSPLOWO2_01_FULL_39_61]|nr:MAG: hypothetical protein A3E13_02555 [Candidatus Woesebacteria bacterium RIFCSPHIGHO2_12_FULL_40_20]OGM67373.1 MAG: hypothetical protein A2962_02810 [Candidatus Woesebacteria bacterium RIFCSPLOWO2_01_FULL_39_61]OGM75470.1 MAG: hypothetical protein A3H19_03055 [Candidatus Woesebacteria bacterium RIFCSPLOWO2_12_FULL_39_9]